MEKKIELSKYCHAVMVNKDWCPCCDRFSKPMDRPETAKQVEDALARLGHNVTILGQLK